MMGPEWKVVVVEFGTAAQLPGDKPLLCVSKIQPRCVDGHAIVTVLLFEEMPSDFGRVAITGVTAD